MLHRDPGLFRSRLLRFQVALRRSSVLAFEESAMLPRWDLLPVMEQHIRGKHQILLCKALLLLHFMVDQAVTYSLTGKSDLLWFFTKDWILLGALMALIST